MGRQGGRQNQDGLTEKQPCMPLLSLQTLKPRQPEGKASLCKPAMPLILRATPSLASFFRGRLAVLTALIEPFVLIVIYLFILWNLVYVCVGGGGNVCGSNLPKAKHSGGSVD